VWRDIILNKGQAELGSTAPVMVFLNKIAAAAAHTNDYMVGDGRSSQQHEYKREGATVPNQSVESVHHNTAAGERAQRASDPTRTNPHNPDEMLVEVSSNPTAPRAIIPKKDYRGDDWAGLDQGETNAALKARIQISIAGLKGVAQANLPVTGLDETKLPAFWSAVDAEAYRKGKW